MTLAGIKRALRTFEECNPDGDGFIVFIHLSSGTILSGSLWAPDDTDVVVRLDLDDGQRPTFITPGVIDAIEMGR